MSNNNIVGKDPDESIDREEGNKEPIDCSQTYGPQFDDCEREWGWDCCLNDDYLNLTVVEDLTEDSTATNPSTETEDVNFCAQQFGSDFVDCGNGFGLDCCWRDDIVFPDDGHHHEMASHEETESSGGAHKEVENKHYVKNFDTTSAIPSEDTKPEDVNFCAQEFGPDFVDCGNGWGLDCCWRADIVFPDDGHHHHETMDLHGMAKHSHVHSKNDMGVLRWLIFTAMIAYVGIALQGRRARLRPTLGSLSRPKKRKPAVSQLSASDRGDDDGARDDEIELQPLI
jgi:hypothetical protein